MVLLISCQGCASAEALHPSQGSPSSCAHRTGHLNLFGTWHHEMYELCWMWKVLWKLQNKEMMLD